MENEKSLFEEILLFISGLSYLAYTVLHIAVLLLFAYFIGVMVYEAVIGG